MSTPTYNRIDIENILKNNGWKCTRQSGSHKIYTNEQGKHMTIRCNKCNKMVFQRLIKEYNLEVKL